MSIKEYPDPLQLFEEWFAVAKNSEIQEPTAMALATVDPGGQPSVRMVLLKDYREGFVFYTNLESDKARDLQKNPRAALCFYWVDKQVRVRGTVEPVSDEEADRYFASRSRQSQIGAWSSLQSRTMAGRFELEKRVASHTMKFGLGAIPRPPFWSGFRLTPFKMEFWKQMPFRLHQRLLYTRSEKGWERSFLYP